MSLISTLDALPIAALILNPEGKIVRSNARARRFVGERENLLDAVAPEARGALTALFQPGQEGLCQTVITAAAGELQRTVRIRVASSAEGVVCTMVDIDSEMRANAERDRAVRAAEEASRLKSEFLANMSHEIRTPMNAIIGMTDLLGQTPLSNEQRRYLDILRSAGDHLLDLINDLLDLSKVEAGRLSLAEIEFNLGEAVQGVIDLMIPRAREKSLTVSAKIAPEVPPVVLGDEKRLRQVLVNLVGNAVKFTDQGRITVRIEPDLADGREGALRFLVEDTGIGIPKEQQARIFQSFTQLDGSSTRRHEGTGLGLSIARSLVELWGGTLSVESTVGRGSTFWFTAVLRPSSGARLKSSGAQLNLLGLTALVVAHDDTSRIILREMLGDWGARVLEATRTEQALGELGNAERNVGLVVIDDQGLVEGGLELAEAVVALGPGRPRQLLVASEPPEPERARLYGLDAHTVRPIKRRALAEAVGRALHGTALHPRDGGPGGQPPLAILVVDDAEENRVLINAYLRDLPHTIEAAENGARAVERFAAAHFDVVLMDLQMPVMDGYAATRALRRLEREEDRPPATILALTADAMPEHVARSLDAGCTGHLAKPLRRHALLEALRAVTPTRKPEPARDRVEIDPELAPLIPAFLDGRRRDLRAIEAAIADADFESLAAIGHTLKGLAGSYGFHRVAEIGAALEAHARSSSIDRLQRSLKDLADHLSRVEVVKA